MNEPNSVGTEHVDGPKPVKLYIVQREPGVNAGKAYSTSATAGRGPLVIDEMMRYPVQNLVEAEASRCLVVAGTSHGPSLSVA